MAFWKKRCDKCGSPLPTQLDRIEDGIRAVLDQLQAQSLKEKQMAISLDQLTTDVNTLQTTLNTGLTYLAAEIAALKASNPTVDFTALDTVVNSMAAQVTAADPGAQSTGTASADAAKK